jgi:hypothetical protein
MSAYDAAAAARGDFQTPVELAREVWKLLPGTDAIVEPTVGTGAFLEAAPEETRRLPWRCFDLLAEHVVTSRERAQRLGFDDAVIFNQDAFALSPTDFDLSPDTRVLAVGNPPWVTSAAQGAAGQANLPEKRNRLGLRGLDALTGKANFDIAEAVLLALLDALRRQSEVHLAFLLKRSVALRLSRQLLGRPGFEGFSFAHIDARRHFGVGVEAGLLQFRRTLSESSTDRILISTHLGAAPSRQAGLVAGDFVEDLQAYKPVAHLEARDSNAIAWRQGLKHDLARVLELRRRADGQLVNGYDELVDIEEQALYPFWKGADIAAQRGASRLFPLYQETLAGPVRGLETRWPKLAGYLEHHRVAFAARRSRIYEGRWPYALFGVGEYLLAPYKVAVSGLHRPARFCLLRPQGGRPSLVDDTSYLLPFTSEREAAVACGFLNSEPVSTFLSCLVDRFAKRPYTKAVLKRVRLPLVAELPSDLADALAASTLLDDPLPVEPLRAWLRHSPANSPESEFRLFAA